MSVIPLSNVFPLNSFFQTKACQRTHCLNDFSYSFIVDVAVNKKFVNTEERCFTLRAK